LNTPGSENIKNHFLNGSFIIIKLARNIIKVSVQIYEVDLILVFLHFAVRRYYIKMDYFAVRRPADAGLLRLFGCFDVRAGKQERSARRSTLLARPLMRRARTQALLELASAKSSVFTLRG
jgi:hypothetical protein